MVNEVGYGGIEPEYRALLMVRRTFTTADFEDGPGQSLDFLYKRAKLVALLEDAIVEATGYPLTEDEEHHVDDLLQRLKLIKVTEDNLDRRERQLVPCDCKKPLVGYIPNKGPRCRLCNRQFTVVEETKGMRTNARARAALDLMQAARAAEEDGNTEAAKRLRGEARGLWS